MADLQVMSDDAFVDHADSVIWASASARNNPRSKYHGEASECYAEALRREKPWLYQRAYNRAFVSCGHTPSKEMVADALAPDAPKDTGVAG